MQLYELETLTINSYVMLYRMELNLLSLFLYFVFVYFTAVFDYCVCNVFHLNSCVFSRANRGFFFWGGGSEDRSVFRD